MGYLVGVAAATACVGGALPSFPPRGAPGANPFDGARFYANPDYRDEVERAAAAAPSAASLIRRVEGVPTAIWLDSIERARSATRYLDDAARQQAAGGAPVLILFVLYDVPGRDCAAASSAGELSADGDGESRYRSRFVDPIAAAFRSHSSLRIAAILEPDALPNLATNLDHAKCAASEAVYRRSVAYAIRSLSMPHVSLYLDAAHAGWLGWDASRARIARVFADVFAEAGGEGSVRGFATNVSNYDSLAARDGALLEPSDPCPDELTYTSKLAESLSAAGIAAHSFIVDTSRNGQPGIRSTWGSWCNVRGAGLGERPRASPAPGIDAYYWVKPPGESDGASDPSAPRHDPACSNPDATPGAPRAGVMFPDYLAQLVALAHPPL